MFMDAMKEELNTIISENGAEMYATSGKELVDFNFKVASYRSASESTIIKDFKKAWYENKELALKYLFYVRDVREGLGERRLFRLCIKDLYEELDERVFDWIAEYGRYDDIFVFIGTKLESKLIDFISDTLASDMSNSLNDKPISLLAKWMPSINTSSVEKRNLAKYLCNKLSLNYSTYRKMLSKLREYIDVLERKLCANEWEEVDYSKVSSQANLKYKEAFIKHDKERREQYLDSLVKGETKINSSTVFPHDIVHKYIRYGSYSWRPAPLDKDITLEEMWKSLPNYVQGNSNTLVVRDGSGSMSCKVGNTEISALEVSTALAIYFSERAEGQFKDNFITFSSRPQLVSFKGYKSLKDKLELAFGYDDCSNTNIQATFELVLNTAVKNNLTQEEIPNLLIISDMEFDEATYHSSNEKLFKTIEREFNEKGYKLPKLIFWNVNSRTGGIPLTQNDKGVILVSGFSPAIVKLVLNEETDPYKALVKELMSDRYKQVTLN